MKLSVLGTLPVIGSLPVVGSGDPVSPTAHYTGYVWARNGLSPPEFETIEGRVLFESLRPIMTVNSILGRGSLEQYLLARHRSIDLLLERAIEEHGVSQVLEIAAGLSARGWRFTARHLRLVAAECAGMSPGSAAQPVPLVPQPVGPAALPR